MFLKYLKSHTLGCKDMGNRKEFFFQLQNQLIDIRNFKDWLIYYSIVDARLADFDTQIDLFLID